MTRVHQRGIALVITLIMLAVVTVMAVLFLGISRRERTAVAVVADLTGARLAADAAAARAQAEILSRIAAQSNRFAYDLIVSTNFINPGGFVPGASSFLNVNYTYANGTPLGNDNDVRQNLTNLFYDPRPPVFIVTNTATGASDFRYYLDFNRNGRFDTNGFFAAPDVGQVVTTNYRRGDPEWIGVLERPDQPHSPSNRFIARYAFLAVPAGKTLDLNHIHNAAKDPTQTTPVRDGFLRNQGVGSWELNLAAFLTDLNTNAWPPPNYFYNPGGFNSGTAFLDALAILTNRYANNYRTLRSVSSLFGTAGADAFRTDHVDGYTDGPLLTGLQPLVETPGRIDSANLPWVGADNTNGFATVDDLFDATRTSVAFTNRLLSAIANPLAYNKYTFNRLLEQLGTDSLPANRDKMHLNYANIRGGIVVPEAVTNFVRWTPLGFFTNAADRLLRYQFGSEVSITNIPIYPTNKYTASVHRLLQVAANIVDATSNRVALTGAPHLPTVFRPRFSRSGTNLFIADFVEVTTTNFLNLRWLDLNLVADRSALPEGTPGEFNIYGIPLVIGAKKGFPSFNEFHLQATAQVTRRLEAEKRTPTAAPVFHQLYELGISNLFGLEAWNSYTQAFPRQLTLVVTNRAAVELRYGTNLPALRNSLTYSTQATNLGPLAWQGQEFRVPVQASLLFLTNSGFYFQQPYFRPSQTNVAFDRTTGFPVPDWKLYITNRLLYAAIDTSVTPARIVDFVNLDNMVATLDISRALVSATNLFSDPNDRESSFWLTNRMGGSAGAMTAGITNQLFVSTNDVLSDAEWASYSLDPVTGQQKQKAIDGFRRFLGMSPLFDPANPATPGPVVQVPFTPTRKLDLQMSWQVNDPLVRYHAEDLYDPFYANTNNIFVLRPRDPIAPSNLGKLNQRYRPWGGRPGAGADNDRWAFNPGVKDPLVRRSDDWDFLPTNLTTVATFSFPNVGWLGRVHRGTPWQTIYLKSAVEPIRNWLVWSGRADTHPTNDWWLMDLFTTAPNDNAARGLLSVNQTNLAAWSAVLSGVQVVSNDLAAVSPLSSPSYSAIAIQPGSTQLVSIVANINATRAQRPGGSFPTLGSVLSAPGLTLASPFLNTASPAQLQQGISDAAYERIPQQILSLLKADEPYMVIYSYGQSLRPADRSIVTAPGIYQGLCTNYQITGEVVTKTAVRFEEFKVPNRPNSYRAVIESYNVLPTD